MRFASWNIWSKGSNLQPKHWRIAAKELAEWDLDIIGLQEIDLNWSKRSDFAHVSQEMADILGYYFFFAPSISVESQHYGNAVLSKHPFVEQGSIQLSPEVIWEKDNHTTEPRTATWVEIEREKNLVFISTHLSNAINLASTDISLKQADTLIKLVKEKLDEDKDVILVGDFNLQPSAKEIQKISQVLPRQNGDAPTWTVHPFEYKGWSEDSPPRFIIDYIFSNLSLNTWVEKSLCSDHLPLLAEE